MCALAQPLNLVGLPLGGTFVSDGGGIQGSTFNPGLAGGGAHYIHYEINDPVSGCTVSTPEEFIDVLFAPTELFLPTDTICFNGFPVLMTGFPRVDFILVLECPEINFIPILRVQDGMPSPIIMSTRKVVPTEPSEIYMLIRAVLEWRKRNFSIGRSIPILHKGCYMCNLISLRNVHFGL